MPINKTNSNDSLKIKRIEKGEEPKSKMFAEIKTTIKDIIDELKKQEETTISNIVEKSIQLYKNFKSLPPEIHALINKYTKNYGSSIKIIEEAIKLLDVQKNPEKAEYIDLWCRTREEMKMMLIGKTTFNQLLTAAETPEESLDKPMKRNIGLDVILWFAGKPIKNLSLEEIILAIKKMWIVANYFYFIDLRKESNDQYHIIFKHHQNKRYSNYWLGYFKELFHSEDLSFKCAVEGEAFDETLSLTIKELHAKD